MVCVRLKLRYATVDDAVKMVVANKVYMALCVGGVHLNFDFKQRAPGVS